MAVRNSWYDTRRKTRPESGVHFQSRPNTPISTASAGAQTSPARARLSLVLVLYFLGIIGVITLAPFRFAIPKSYQVLTVGGAFDIFANILLFLPLGFLYPMARGSRDEPSPVQVLLLGLLLSSAIETVQLFEHDRCSSVVDVMTNGTGALVGALLQRAAARRVKVNARLIGRVSLEIPLIGLIYLLVPLLVVSSQAAVSTPLGLLSVVPLALVGARLLSSVQRNHFGPARLLDSRIMGAIAGAWALLGLFPLLGQYPLIGAALVAAVALTTWFESSYRTGLYQPERRFEATALRSATPYIVVYFLLMAFLPLAAGIGHFRFDFGLTGAGDDVDQQMIRLLEPVAALTVLGYLIAEARGRTEQAFRTIAPRLAVECSAVALVIEMSRAVQRGVGGSGVQLILMIGAGLLGAAIYHHQRQHVRWIIANRGPAPRDEIGAAA